MSYKAFAAIKGKVELEVIKNMTPEEINELLNKQHSKIKKLEAQNAEMLAILEELEFANLTWHGPECAFCCGTESHTADCPLGNLLQRIRGEQ